MHIKKFCIAGCTTHNIFKKNYNAGYRTHNVLKKYLYYGLYNP